MRRAGIVARLTVGAVADAEPFGRQAVFGVLIQDVMDQCRVVIAVEREAQPPQAQRHVDGDVAVRRGEPVAAGAPRLIGVVADDPPPDVAGLVVEFQLFEPCEPCW